MPLLKSQVTQACPTVTGNQTFTGSLGGAVPTAAKFIFIRESVINSISNHGVVGHGFTDGINDRSVSIRLEDGQASTDTRRRTNNTHCITTIDITTTAIEYSASFVSFAANSVTINWDVVGATGFQVVCILYAGVSAVVGDFFPNTTINATVTESGLGITPRYIEFISVGRDNNIDAPHGKLYTGFSAVFDSIINQGSLLSSDRSSKGTSETSGGIFNNRISGDLKDDGSLKYTLELTSVSAGEFIVTTRDGGASGTDAQYYLALETDIDEVNVITGNIPTSTGDFSYTGLGLRPGLLYMMGGAYSAFNTLTSDGSGGTRFWSLFSSSRKDSVWVTSQDAVGTSRTRSSIQNSPHNQQFHDGTALCNSTFIGTTPDGYTLNYSVVPVTGFAYIIVGFENGLVGAGNYYFKNLLSGVN